MAPSSSANNEIAFQNPNLGIRVFKDGRVQRSMGTDTVPASVHPVTGVRSKDVTIDRQTGVSARLYIPKFTNPNQKLPLLIYFHGGGFCIESPFSPTYHNYVNSLVAEAQIVAVSVHYRIAPEHPLPIAYEDSWDAVKWVAAGKDRWLNDHADFNRVFFAGDSAGGNITHHMGTRVGSENLRGLNLVGVVLLHPNFRRKTPGQMGEVAERNWRFVCPSSTGLDDPWINPANDPNLLALACQKLLICLAEKDLLCEMGKYYHNRGWRGAVEIWEDKGEWHVYHLLKPTSENALALLKKVASFINED